MKAVVSMVNNLGGVVHIVMLAYVLLYQLGVYGLRGGAQRLVMEGELIVLCAVQGHYMMCGIDASSVLIFWAWTIVC